jgi:hypothetical protein
MGIFQNRSYEKLLMAARMTLTSRSKFKELFRRWIEMGTI